MKTFSFVLVLLFPSLHLILAEPEVLSADLNYGVTCKGNLVIKDQARHSSFSSSQHKLDEIVYSVYNEGSCCWKIFRRSHFRGRFVLVRRIGLTEFPVIRVRSLLKAQCDHVRVSPDENHKQRIKPHRNLDRVKEKHEDEQRNISFKQVHRYSDRQAQHQNKHERSEMEAAKTSPKLTPDEKVANPEYKASTFLPSENAEAGMQSQISQITNSTNQTFSLDSSNSEKIYTNQQHQSSKLRETKVNAVSQSVSDKSSETVIANHDDENSADQADVSKIQVESASSRTNEEDDNSTVNVYSDIIDLELNPKFAENATHKNFLYVQKESDAFLRNLKDKKEKATRHETENGIFSPTQPPGVKSSSSHEFKNPQEFEEDILGSHQIADPLTNHRYALMTSADSQVKLMISDKPENEDDNNPEGKMHYTSKDKNSAKTYGGQNKNSEKEMTRKDKETQFGQNKTDNYNSDEKILLTRQENSLSEEQRRYVLDKKIHENHTGNSVSDINGIEAKRNYSIIEESQKKPSSQNELGNRATEALIQYASKETANFDIKSHKTRLGKNSPDSQSQEKIAKKTNSENNSKYFFDHKRNETQTLDGKRSEKVIDYTRKDKTSSDENVLYTANEGEYIVKHSHGQKRLEEPFLEPKASEKKNSEKQNVLEADFFASYNENPEALQKQLSPNRKRQLVLSQSQRKRQLALSQSQRSHSLNTEALPGLTMSNQRPGTIMQRLKIKKEAHQESISVKGKASTILNEKFESDSKSQNLLFNPHKLNQPERKSFVEDRSERKKYSFEKKSPEKDMKHPNLTQDIYKKKRTEDLSEKYKSDSKHKSKEKIAKMHSKVISENAIPEPISIINVQNEEEKATGSISFAREVEYDYYEDTSAHNSDGHSAHDYEDHSAHDYEDHSAHNYEDHIARTYDYEYDSLEPTFECQYMRDGREHLQRLLSRIHYLNYEYYQSDEEVPEIPGNMEIMNQRADAGFLLAPLNSAATTNHGKTSKLSWALLTFYWLSSMQP